MNARTNIFWSKCVNSYWAFPLNLMFSFNENMENNLNASYV